MSDEEDNDPISNPKASLAMECRPVKLRKVRNLPFAAFNPTKGYIMEPKMTLYNPIKGISEMAFDMK